MALSQREQIGQQHITQTLNILNAAYEQVQRVLDEVPLPLVSHQRDQWGELYVVCPECGDHTSVIQNVITGRYPSRWWDTRCCHTVVRVHDMEQQEGR